MRIDAKTEIYGIIGNPVAHSLSPVMHNAAFEALGLNKIYAAFPVTDVAGAMHGLRALDIRGASVTIPHKEAVIAHLDRLDPVAEKIGAVNTLVNRQGRIEGLNTDWLGANRALAEHIALAGSRCLLLGAGGSARAIGFGLREAGCEVVLASRTPEKGKALAAALGCPWLPLADIQAADAEILVNATSVGMHPEAERSPVPIDLLAGFQVVMDIVYAPLETRLLREAREKGCLAVDGLAMLLHQGAAQFELWTGESAPLAVMRKALTKAMEERVP